LNRLVFALLLLAFPILSASQTNAPIPKPEIKEGDSWNYRGTNVLAPGTHEHETRVSFANDKVILVVSTRKSDGKEFDSAWTREWNAVTSYAGVMYRPHAGVFRFPLRAGDKYEVKFEVLRPRVNTVVTSVTGTAKVVGWDTVEVPAGKFRAMRVEAEGAYRELDGSGSYQQHATLWYVPEVKRWAKFQVVNPRVTISEELLGFRLQ
jgi:hypothetical protein